MCFFIIVFSELHSAVEEKACRVVELEQELEVLEGELSAAQQAAKQAPSRTMKALVERLRNQLTMKEKQHRVSGGDRGGHMCRGLYKFWEGGGTQRKLNVQGVH